MLKIRKSISANFKIQYQFNTLLNNILIKFNNKILFLNISNKNAFSDFFVILQNEKDIC